MIRRIAAVALLLALTGCAAEVVAQRETLLAAAGFRVEPAQTPAELAALRALPPHRLMPARQEGRLVWEYADPDVCRCRYVGDQQAYRQYARLWYTNHLAEIQNDTAQLNALGWYGPWGPPWYSWGPWR